MDNGRQDLSASRDRRVFSAWAARAPREARNLSREVSGREADFLRLGEALQQIAEDCAALTGQARDLAVLALGEDLRADIEALADETGPLTRSITALDAGGDEAELAALRRVLSRLVAKVGDFRRIYARLRMLGISTRIESARLGKLGGGFLTLADDVDKLAEKIAEDSGRVGQNAEDVGSLLGEAAGRAQEIAAAYRRLAHGALASMETNVGRLKGMASGFSDLAASLPDRVSRIALSIGEVAASLQFHDIVRQQVEHVAEAMEEAGEMLAGGAPGDEAGDELETLRWVLDVLTLQASQLDSASARFATAVASLREHLTRVAGDVRDMTRAVEGLLASGEASGENLLAVIESGVQESVGAMNAFAAQTVAFGRDMQAVGETLERISSFVADIEEVGAEIKLIALNAGIKAAHTGSEGLALGVLALEVQVLASAAGGHTTGILELIGETRAGSERLKSAAAVHADISGLTDGLHRLGHLAGLLRGQNTAVAEAFARIKSGGLALASRIEAIARGIAFDRPVVAAIGSLRADLSRHVAIARTLVPDSGDQQRPERLRRMLERYTMDAERIVHQWALGEGGDGGQASEPGGDGEDPDGNIELF